MKKAAFLLALVMLLGLLPGCSQAEGEASVQSVSMICGLGSVGLADRFAGIVSPLGETKIKKDDSLSVDTIKVKVGDKVNAGDTVVILEAMKMQNNIEAEKDGKVTAICVKPGQAVLEEDALVVIE